MGIGRDADRLRQEALRVDHLDLPVRFVYLNLFYRLAHYPAEQVAAVVEDQDSAAAYRDEFEHDLEVLVRLVDVEQCADPRQIRWEIVNACAIRAWDRAERLYVRLQELAQEEPAKALARRARFEIQAVFTARWELPDVGLNWWAPIPDKKWESLLGLLLCSGAFEDGPEGALSVEELSRLEDAAHHLTKAVRLRPDVELVNLFLLLRCHSALGRPRDAAADCETLLKRRDEFDDQIRDIWVWRLYALAVESYELGDQVDRAIAASDRWLREFPNQADIHQCRARLFGQQGDLDSAHDSLQKEVASDPPRGENPAVSIALRFGELYGAPDAQWKRFRRNLDPSEAGLVRSLVHVHWPTSVRLEGSNFEDWIDACCLLLKHTPDNPGLAAFPFGRIVENLLRARVFERFRATLRQEDLSRIRSGPEKDPLTTYVKNGDRGVITLDQMLNEIRYREPRSLAGRSFREWLGHEKSTGLLQMIDLKRLGDINNRAKHKREPELTWKDAEDMARLSREVLDVILLM
jgi:tetratricopeptide (TPR) repeat protein